MLMKPRIESTSRRHASPRSPALCFAVLSAVLSSGVLAGCGAPAPTEGAEAPFSAEWAANVGGDGREDPVTWRFVEGMFIETVGARGAERTLVRAPFTVHGASITVDLDEPVEITSDGSTLFIHGEALPFHVEPVSPAPVDDPTALHPQSFIDYCCGACLAVHITYNL